MPKLAARFAVSDKVAQKLKYQWRDRGTLQPETHKVGRERSLSPQQSERLNKLIGQDASLMLEHESARRW